MFSGQDGSRAWISPKEPIDNFHSLWKISPKHSIKKLKEECAQNGSA